MDYPIAAPGIITDVTLALAPDGSALTYVANVEGTRQLVLRRLDSFEAHLIPQTEGAAFPFFSPDGEWIATTSRERES